MLSQSKKTFLSLATNSKRIEPSTPSSPYGSCFSCITTVFFHPSTSFSHVCASDGKVWVTTILDNHSGVEIVLDSKNKTKRVNNES
jgi:hypothetical protein